MEITNGTMVCSACNAVKGGSRKGNFVANRSLSDVITYAVYDIVKNREGDDIFNRMFNEAGTRGAFREWGQIGWLEFKLDILIQIRKGFEEGVYE